MASSTSKGIAYTFTAKPWVYPAPQSWHFMSLPEALSQQIRAAHQGDEEGWGRLKVVAVLGNTEWKTAIWFDTRLNTYLLPLKAEIRKKEQVHTDMAIQVVLWI